MSPHPPSPRHDTPESLLADCIARAQAGEAVDLEELCRAHPEHAAALRVLHEPWDRLRVAARLAGARAASATKDQPQAHRQDASPASFAARLEKEYGQRLDPGVSLEPAPSAAAMASAPSSPASASTEDLVKRLAQHGLKESRYRLESEVARGGMGAILKVWDEDLRRYLAMKVILGKADSSGEGATPPLDGRQLARFLEEAQVTGQLDHPGIVPVHELGLDSDGRVYFTMKLVKGRDLKKIFDLVFERKESWNETRALSVMLKVCEAMAYAHTKGVIHRDLKPANVMVGSFGEVYVMDWGLSRVIGRKDAHDIRLKPAAVSSLGSVKTARREEREEAPDSPIVTMDGDVMGTPAYMPPEQARGEVELLSARSDVYSIGAMLYQLLARQMPYVNPRARLSHHTVLAMVVNGPPAPLHSLRTDVPAELAAICEKAMARDPSQRYADTLELAEDLRAFLEHRVVHAYETGAVAELKKWVTRNKPLAVSSAAAFVIALGGLAWVSIVEAHARRAIEVKNTELSEAATTIGRTNVALDAAKSTAEANERIATQRADDVLSLSAIQDLQELIDRAAELWPAHAENIARYEEWLRDARALIDGRPGDPARRIKARPGLLDHKRKLAELRARALPETEEEIARARAAHPRAAEFDGKLGLLVWISRMLGRVDPAEAQPGSAGFKPARRSAPQASPDDTAITDANELNNLAWPLVAPARTLFGQEGRGLELAQRAVDLAMAEERATMRDSLAWALFANARFDEALAEEKRALADSPTEMRPEFEGYQKKLESALMPWISSEGRTEKEHEREALSDELSKLDAELSRRRQWSFADAEGRWWHVQLSKLVADLETFAHPQTGLLSPGVSKERGWGIEKRAEFARTIERETLSGPEASQRWAEAIASIGDEQRCPQYHGFRLSPQLGLLPIGKDRESGLWEFAHLQTGEPAARDAEGKLVLKEETGLVFVLIPGGTFKMGAQSADPADANYDPQAIENEQPVHEVTLAPYFLSKYEMTQGQWLRFTGSNPSRYDPQHYILWWNAKNRPADLLHPVERVSWVDCTETLARLALGLPTEAQWERAARAGTDTPWWTGRGLESLAGAANLYDSYANRHGSVTWSVWDKELDDGAVAPMAVGSYRANGFGLHDIHGNLSEWCREGFGEYQLPVRAGDGERQPSSARRVIRGGSCDSPAAFARSAIRNDEAPGNHSESMGVRPARGIATP